MATVALDTRDAFVPMPHGSGIYARRLAEALRAAASADGLEYWFLERGGRLPELWWEQITFPRLLRARRPGIVHTPNCFLPLHRPCPGIVTIHDLAFEAHPRDFSRRTGWKYRTFARRAARSAERVICDSCFTRDDVCARYGVDPARTRVIPLAPALASGPRSPPPAPYLLAVGDLRPKKNLERLVTAWRSLREEGLPHRLVLVGADAGQGARLRELAGDEPLQLTGFAGDEEVDALMRGADLLVHPSLYEGFGMAVVEAMARDCPVAMADATALPETGGDAAVYFDPYDPAAITTAVRSVIEDPARRAQLVAAGRARVAELTWERTAAATVAVYRELL
ncbi:MAG: glycosyltransferase family 4 protein [Actinomycetota bacterium]|nr:glycosyltransferase family 4 protein [Actinomycetota bacterium]